jgi:hypothetical protein
MRAKTQQEYVLFPPAREEFKWPCYKRKAHGKHYKACFDHPEELGMTGPFEPCPNCEECPGVLAHPATMIGGGDAQARPEAQPG